MWTVGGNEISKTMSIMILLPVSRVSVSGTSRLASLAMSRGSLGALVIRTRKYPGPTLRYYVLPQPPPPPPPHRQEAARRAPAG